MLLYYINKMRRLPPKIVLQKVGILIKGKFRDLIGYWHDFLLPTYSCSFSSNNTIKMRYSYCILIDCLLKHNKIIGALSNLYVNHNFDLLGSGWIKVFYGMKARGLEGYCYNTSNKVQAERSGEWLKGRINKPNLKYARKIWRLVDDNYQPIDWQLDFKSGYRWSEKTWYKNIEYGHKLGVDIKVPWELSRMQHLPMLAYAYTLASYNIEGFQNAKVYVREFCNQVLDFVANNPPHFGVNWRCTMDVGIRVANWLVAYDMFEAFGVKFDNQFKAVFARSVYEHGKYCYENLEYHPKFRNNHYLSDIAGLLFAAVYLENNSETNIWLAFAVQELISEMDFEYNNDGSNFEASTNYHRLSTEIMLYCAILCLTLSDEKRHALINYDFRLHKVKPKLKQPFEQEYEINNNQLLPDYFWERLEKACEFTMHILKPSGEVPQIGDNDSGRFLKLWPGYMKRTVGEAVKIYKNLEGYKELPSKEDYWDENILDHRHLLGVAGVLFNRKDFLSYVEQDNPEVTLVRMWLKDKVVISYRQKQITEHQVQGRTIHNSYNLSNTSIDILLEKLNLQFGKPIKYVFRLKNKTKKITDGMVIYSYPNFGLYIFKSLFLYLAVRCGSIGQNGLGGHAHNDQLSMELTIDGKDIICDSGTYVYTPLPERRNEFRSTSAHFTPCDGYKEQNKWFSGLKGLFQLHNNAKAEVKYFSLDGFMGKHDGFGRSIYRIIKIEIDKVYCYDFNVNEKIKGNNKLFSGGYGKYEEKKHYNIY